MKAEAFGEMGILPRDFYPMDRDDFNLMKKGFYDKRVYDQRVIRRAVATIIAPWLEKAVDPMAIWPVPGDKEEKERMKQQRADTSLATLEMLNKHRQGGFKYVKKNGRIIAENLN